MTLTLKGKFIVLDGPDGCGKSTQMRLLSEYLNRNGIETESFRDPGTTVIGEKIRNILLDNDNEGMQDNVEVLLYMAARAQLWAEKIKPALETGKCVVMDRWLSSTCAYQGYAGGFGVEKVIGVAELSLERVWPDVTIILDIDTQSASTRMDRELDRMEQKSAEYHENVRKGFLELAEKYDKVYVVNAKDSIEQVNKNIIEIIERI